MKNLSHCSVPQNLDSPMMPLVATNFDSFMHSNSYSVLLTAVISLVKSSIKNFTFEEDD